MNFRDATVSEAADQDGVQAAAPLQLNANEDIALRLRTIGMGQLVRKEQTERFSIPPEAIERYSDADWAWEEIYEKHTDYIRESQFVICWGFDLEALEEADSGYYAWPVKVALLQGLKAGAASRSKRVRERSLTVWVGDYGRYYWVAVPGNLSAQVVRVLSPYLEQAAGYDTTDFGRIPEVPLVAAFRYQMGQVIEYSDESVAGTEYVDDEENYGSGLTIRRRVVMPAELLGREKYQA